MKKIALSQGKYAIVDDEDYDYLSQYRWCYKSGAGYAVRNTYPVDYRHPKMIYMHREVLQPEGAPLVVVVDHISRDRLDNRRSNLRAVSRRENLENSDYWENR